MPSGAAKVADVNGQKVRTTAKLGESEAEWIVGQKRKGEMTNTQIAEGEGIKTGWMSGALG